PVPKMLQAKNAEQAHLFSDAPFSAMRDCTLARKSDAAIGWKAAELSAEASAVSADAAATSPLPPRATAPPSSTVRAPTRPRPAPPPTRTVPVRPSFTTALKQPHAVGFL